MPQVFSSKASEVAPIKSQPIIPYLLQLKEMRKAAKGAAGGRLPPVPEGHPPRRHSNLPLMVSDKLLDIDREVQAVASGGKGLFVCPAEGCEKKYKTLSAALKKHITSHRDFSPTPVQLELFTKTRQKRGEPQLSATEKLNTYNQLFPQAWQKMLQMLSQADLRSR